MAESSSVKTSIFVAVIGVVGVIAAAIINNWETFFPKETHRPGPAPSGYPASRSDITPPQPRPEPVTPPKTESAPAPSGSPPAAAPSPAAVASPPAAPESLPAAIQDPSSDAVAAMQWIAARCGPGIALVVPNPPGSRIDVAARSFASALGNSGVRPTPLVTNMPGVFIANGRFSVEKFDEWHRNRNATEGCLLAMVPDYARDQFPRPRLNATVQGSTYGIVLPRGTMSETGRRWNTVFRKADKDPDFTRELLGTGLQIEVLALD